MLLSQRARYHSHKNHMHLWTHKTDNNTHKKHRKANRTAHALCWGKLPTSHWRDMHTHIQIYFSEFLRIRIHSLFIHVSCANFANAAFAFSYVYRRLICHQFDKRRSHPFSRLLLLFEFGAVALFFRVTIDDIPICSTQRGFTFFICRKTNKNKRYASRPFLDSGGCTIGKRANL